MKAIIITIAFILTATFTFGQEISVPVNAQEVFDKDYNTNNEAKNIVWTKSNSNYVVYFEYNGKKRSVLFDEAGNYKENRIFIPYGKLNEKTANYIETNYSKNSIVQCYEVNSNTAPFRNEVEIDVNGEMIPLFFRPNGDFHYKK